jgi:hypothetical protein
LLHLDTYPTFYRGIAVCDSWYESKDDKFEAPVQFVLDIVEQYKKNPEKFENEDWKKSPKDYVLGYIRNWVSHECDRVIREFTVNDIFDVKNFRETNTNYFIFTKPGLYTRKFTNKEDDLTREELILLNHNENPNLIVKTEKRNIKMSEYVFNYEEVKEPLKKDEESLTDLFSDLDSVDSTNDFGIDDLSDLFDLDDIEYKDKEADRMYWLYSEAERSYNTEAELEDLGKDLDVSSELPEPEHEYLGLLNLNDTWILDIRGLDKQTFIAVSKYLQQYRCEDGMPLILRSSEGTKLSKIKLSKNLDRLGVQVLMKKE